MELSKKILVVHDIKSVISKGESFFNREHIQLLTSSSNEEALSIHKDEQVDLIITNIDSPQMDGITHQRRCFFTEGLYHHCSSRYKTC